LRIVGGEWRGRPLEAPAGRGTRPTSDKVREAMFDVLGALPQLGTAALAAPASPMAGQRVLDLFAGSGALGIEALSRGAASCTFVESERFALRALRANLQHLDVGSGRTPKPRAGGERPNVARARVLATDVRRGLRADACREPRYTLVFADPPYERYTEIRPALVRLLEPVLAPGAVLVIETAAGTLAGLPWTEVRHKRYGDTEVTFLVADASHLEREGATVDDDARPG
jgi:16S rRNA (guanine966-N2)-methyltransferase